MLQYKETGGSPSIFSVSQDSLSLSFSWGFHERSEATLLYLCPAPRVGQVPQTSHLISSRGRWLPADKFFAIHCFFLPCLSPPITSSLFAFMNFLT